ncbi:hypothetical protein ACFLVG_04410 [Chloroflexota bacterium]
MEYTIFRDVLIILVSIAAVLSALVGGLLFFLLRSALMKDITSEVNKRLDDECRKLRGQTDIQAGVTYWTQKMYDHAIDFTKRALEDAGDVLDDDRIIFGQSNLAYYYAEKHRQQPSWDLREEAIELAKIGYEKYSSTVSKYKKPDWMDNYAFVRTSFIKDDEEKEEVTRLINELLSRGDLKTVHNYLKEYKQGIQSLEF